MPFDLQIQRTYLEKKLAAFEAVKDIKPIAALHDDFSGVEFGVISSAQGIEQIIDDNQIIMISGAQFGDEAKGKWGNAFSKKVHKAVRANSGTNTGRTICYNGEKLSFHLTPTALIEGIPSFIGAETVADPISFEQEELELLREKGISYDTLAIGNIFITTPYHRIIDVLGSALNASTGVGISPTHKSIKAKTCPLLDDLCNDEGRLRRVLAKDYKNYVGFIAAEGLSFGNIIYQLSELQQKNKRIVPDHVLAFAQAQNQLDFLVDLYTQRVAKNPNFPKRVDVGYEVQQALKQGEKILIEVTQSHLLSNSRQQGYRYSTSADVTALGALASLGVSPLKYKTIVINVNKFPGSSRVGPGDIPWSFVAQNHFAESGVTSLKQLGDACINFEAICDVYFNSVQKNGILEPVQYADVTGTYEIGEAMAISNARTFDEKGATTGKPRITGLFDCVLGKFVADEQGPYTVISCMDRGSLCDKVGLVVGYVVSLPSGLEKIDCNGEFYRTGKVIMPGDRVQTSDVLQYCVPIIKVMDGWKNTTLSQLQPGEKLPLPVSQVLAAIEHYTGFKVLAIGTGPQTNQALYLKQ